MELEGVVSVDVETPVAVADDAFGTDLYLLLAERAGDTVFSPASVAAALRMALCGARGETARELAAALHLDAPPDGPPDAAADAAAEGLRSFSSLVGEIASAGSLTFRVANTAWVQTGLPLLPAFTARLRDAALAQFAEADFATAHERARAEINRVIAEQTEGKITDLLPPGTVDQLTRLVLANALYLKAPWSDPFPQAQTRDAPFHPDGPAGERLTVPMMHGTATRAYARADGYQAVLLAYADSRLAMAIVLPDGPLDDLRPRLADGGMRGLLSGTAQRRVTLSMPRFRLEAGFDLIPALRRLGVRQAFTDQADFAGITDAARLRIDAIAHKAYVDVDEHGTEAAAATAVAMRLLALTQPPPRVEMVVDRPFLFAIIDAPTRLPIFCGQVTHPHGSR
ncbi:MAG TPA: serpin family protein [Streptosporangiaceae bacterium]